MAPFSSPPRCRSLRPVLGMVGWVALLATVALGGRALGQGVLAPPSLGEPGTWGEWASGRTPVEAAFAVLALVVVALAWYLLVATVLVAAARLGGAGRLVSVAEVLTVPLVRRTVHAVLGVGLVGTSVAGAAASPGPPLPGRAWLAPTVELVVATVPDTAPQTAAPDTTDPVHDTAAEAAAPAGTVPATGPEAAAEATPDDLAPDDLAPDDESPVMRLIPGPEAPAKPSFTGPSPPVEAPATEAQVLSSEREVRPGDHLWSLAVQILEDAGAPATDDGDVITYWRQLIDANLDRLADPDNPDLIFPGQVLTVPSTPAGAPAP